MYFSSNYNLIRGRYRATRSHSKAEILGSAGEPLAETKLPATQRSDQVLKPSRKNEMEHPRGPCVLIPPARLERCHRLVSSIGPGT